MNVLKTKDLTKIYGSGTTEVIALNHANISVDQGEFVAVIGTSGSGKSTLLFIMREFLLMQDKQSPYPEKILQ